MTKIITISIAIFFLSGVSLPSEPRLYQSYITGGLIQYAEIDRYTREESISFIKHMEDNWKSYSCSSVQDCHSRGYDVASTMSINNEIF